MSGTGWCHFRSFNTFHDRNFELVFVSYFSCPYLNERSQFFNIFPWLSNYMFSLSKVLKPNFFKAKYVPFYSNLKVGSFLGHAALFNFHVEY